MVIHHSKEVELEVSVTYPLSVLSKGNNTHVDTLTDQY